MQIPRYKGNLGSTPIQSGRTLTTGVASAQGLVNMGQTMLNAVTDFAEQKIQIEAKLRDQDILNKKTLAEGDSLMAANDFDFSLENRKDHENFLPEYDKSWKVTTNKVKKERFTDKEGNFDEIAWKQYEPFHNRNYLEGKVKVQGRISKARNAQSVTAYNNAFTQTTDSITTATSIPQVIGNYETFLNGTHGKYAGLATFDQGTLDSKKTEMLATANNQMMFLQSGTNGKAPIYQTPTGETATDWSTVAKNAANPEVKMVDVAGNELTVDDPVRADFIKKAQQLSSEQDTFDANQITVNQRQSKDTFSDRIVALASGKPQPTFLADLEKDPYLNGEAKITLKNAYATTLSNLKEKTAKYNTPAGMKMHAMLTVMVGAGMIDTEAEKDAVHQALYDGYLKPEQYNTLMTNIEKGQKDKNQYKKDLYSRAVKTILKEVGTPTNILSMIDEANATGGKQGYDMLMQIIASGQLSETAMIAVNNLDQVLAAGEKKGFSAYNMLANSNSPNYVVREITTVYKDVLEKEKVKDFEQKAQAYMKTDESTKKTGLFRIDPVGFVNYSGRGQPIVNKPPLKGQDESLPDYIQRLHKWNQQNSPEALGMPSFLRSDVVGGETTQGIVVIPDSAGNE